MPRQKPRLTARPVRLLERGLTPMLTAAYTVPVLVNGCDIGVTIYVGVSAFSPPSDIDAETLWNIAERAAAGITDREDRS